MSESEFEGPPEEEGAFDEDAEVDAARAEEAEPLAEEAGIAEASGEAADIDPRILQIKSAVEQQLLANAQTAAEGVSAEAFAEAGNIQGVAVGLGAPVAGSLANQAQVSGDPGRAELTVFVAEPQPVEQVRSAIVSSTGAEAAGEDLPINVVVTGIIDAQPHRFRLRRAPGGISIGHFRITAGTLGCLSRGRTAPRSGRMLLLSNNHVVANSNAAAFGDCISQPGSADGGRCPADQIAILERFVPIAFGGATNHVDCGTGWAWPDRVRRELVRMSGATPTFFRIASTPVAPTLGMLVGKSGRTTQVTAGRITALSATINVNYSGRIATFVDQIAIQGTSGLFSRGGDSGSCIWTWDSRRAPVGLLFAGGGNVTFANKISRVLAALDIALVT